jgi:ATP-binding cassette, subfamily C (CFTR/MRP), member 10
VKSCWNEKSRIFFSIFNLSVYLLDNILSALDAHVARHVIKYAILGLLATKTRIIVTEHPTLLNRAHKIFHIENGRVTESQRGLGEEEADDDDGVDDDSEVFLGATEMFTQIEQKTEDQQSVDSVLLEESREKGTLAQRVFTAYFRAMTFPLAFCVLLFVFVMQLSRNATDLWLTYWVASTSNSSNVTLAPDSDFLDDSLHFYLPVYTGLAVVNSLVTLGRSFLFAYAGIRAAKFIHTKLLNSVFFVSIVARNLRKGYKTI